MNRLIASILLLLVVLDVTEASAGIFGNRSCSQRCYDNSAYWGTSPPCGRPLRSGTTIVQQIQILQAQVADLQGRVLQLEQERQELLRRSQPAASLSAPQVLRDVRTWTDISGKVTIRARLIAVQGSELRFEKENGRLASTNLAKLSLSDQEYVRTLLVATTAQSLRQQ